MKKNLIPTSFLAALLLHTALPQAAHAATYYWDNNGLTAGFGTAGGTWGSDTNWSTDDSGVNPPSVTSPTTSDNLNFGAGVTGLGGGTVSVTGTQNAGTLTFASGSGAITLSGGTAINLPATSTITVNNATNTISTPLTGAGNSLTKDGTGTLILSGANTYTGTTIIQTGILQIGNGTSGSLNGTTGTDLTFTGTSTLNVKEANTVNQGMGTLSFNSGEGTVINTFNTTASTLTFSGMNARNSGATGNFTISGGTASTNKIVLSNNANAPLSSSGSNDRGIFYNLYSLSTAPSFARYDTSNLYFRGTNYSGDTNATTTASPYGSAVDLSLGNVDTSPAASVSLNTLKVLPTTNPRSFNVGNGNTLSINGVLAVLPSGGTGSTAVQFRLGTGTAGQGSLQPASGSEVVLAGVRADAFALTTSSLAIGYVIKDNGATPTKVTFVGNVSTVVQAPNTYTGVTTINSGFVRSLNWADAGSPSGLGTGSTGTTPNAADIVINGGILNYGNVTAAVPARTNRLITIGPGGATLDCSGNSGTANSLTIGQNSDGTSSGSFLFSKSDAPATLTLANNAPAANRYGVGTVGAAIGNPGTGANVASVIKTGASGTWQLAGNNTYTGNTTVSAGTLNLTSTGTLKFAPTANDLCNKVTGGGTANFDGTFNIDLTNAAIANSNAWTLVDVTTKTYGGTFAVTGFTNSSGVWTKVDGDKTWTFTQSTGVLGLAVVSTGPTITLTGTLGAVNTNYGTASTTPTSFTLAGSDLTGAPGNLTVTPPAGYEVSISSGSGYTTSLSVPYSSSTRSAITVYVRLAADAAVNGGAGYTGDITVEGGGASSQTIATVSSTVAPVDLTITANNQTKNFGATQTTPVTGSTAFTSSGLKNGETVGTVTLDYSSGALDAGDLPGSTSTITPSAATGGTFDPSNYNAIVYNTGTLTVLTAPTITLGGTLGSVDTTYGTASATPTSFTVSGSDLVPATGNLTVTPPAGYEVSSGAGYSSSLSVPYTGGTLSSTEVSVRLAATTAVNGGAGYTGNITVEGGGASSQTIATASSTVAPADLTITADDQDKAYNTTQTSPVTGSNEFTPDGLMNGDGIDTVTLTYGTGALDATDAVGSTSTITPSAADGSLDPDNYSISYVPGTLTVVKATPTATLAVNNSPVTYNGTAQTATVGITSSVTGTVQNIQIGGAANQTNAGTYAVTADFVPDDTTNYDTLTGVSAGNFVIAKADAIVVVAPYTATYDGTPKTATVTSITGVNGETDATVGTVTLTNTTHTNAGIYASDSWTFTGTANYNNIGSSTSTITVQNSSFETPDSQNGVWARITSVWNPSFTGNSQYQQTNDNSRFATRTDAGTWYANLTDPSTTITQNLSTNVTSGDTLAVTFYIGREIGQVGGVMSATFLVDGTPYTETFDTTGLTAGTWQSYTLTKTIANSGALTLRFSNVSGRPWLDNVSNISRTSAGVQTLLTNTINKATPTATLAVNNSPVTFNGSGQAATVSVTTSSVPGSPQNILTGGAATQTAAGTYAVTANFVPTDSTNYNTLTALSAGDFTINSANYTLTYTAGANGSISGDTPQTVAGGASGTAVNAVADTGYSFVEWSDGSTDNPRTDADVAANVSVSATFAINTYTLTYTAGANGTITGDTPQTVDYNDSGQQVTAVPDTGYRFVDWSDGSTDNPRTDSNVTADASVTANFAIDTFTLTYTAGANGSITGTSPQTVASGANGTAVTAVPATGYSFVDWSDGSTDNPRTDSNVTADASVTANFAIDTFTLTYTAGANGSITGTTSQTVDYNTSGTAVTAVPATGYSFVDWSDGSTTNPRTDSSVTANVSVTANFAIDAITYADWATANGVTGGVNGDSNNDGVPNGLAYFMGVTGQATNPGLNANNEVTWPVNSDYQGTFEVQTSTDLVTWTDVNPRPTPSGGNLTYTLTGSGKQFVRLSVTPD